MLSCTGQHVRSITKKWKLVPLSKESKTLHDSLRKYWAKNQISNPGSLRRLGPSSVLIYFATTAPLISTGRVHPTTHNKSSTAWSLNLKNFHHLEFSLGNYRICPGLIGANHQKRICWTPRRRNCGLFEANESWESSLALIANQCKNSLFSPERTELAP